ncbi:hypothetical protein NDU88_000316 [Pleurodeles waltl]|uniref:Uncharacterized protein n=1 Tax=Pleurodeles waltl TaxID=8319 RepID=A0AAV7S4W4_PLEWA|nr:hypothetical protein NDU88_000316 [Pleurodeles waltl]
MARQAHGAQNPRPPYSTIHGRGGGKQMRLTCLWACENENDGWGGAASCTNNAPAPVRQSVHYTHSSLGIWVSSLLAPRPASGLKNTQGRGSTRDRGPLLRSRLQQRGRAPPHPANGTSGSSDLQCTPGAQDVMLDVRATPPPPARQSAELRS